MYTRNTRVRHRLTRSTGRVYNIMGACPFDDSYMQSVAAVETFGPNPMRFVNSTWYYIVRGTYFGEYVPEELLERAT